MIFEEWDIYFMKQALNEAYKAFEEKEVPIGCVIVYENKILSRAHNLVEKLNDATAHAELIAIQSAIDLIQQKYITNSTIYITMEPCLMCYGAILNTKIDRIVYGISDFKSGFNSKHNLNFKNYKKGILEKEIVSLMQNFFENLRKN